MVAELRPRGVGEILDTAVAMFRARFRALILVTLAVVVPVEIASALVLLSSQPDDYSVGITGTAPVYDDNELGIQIAALVVILIVSTLATAFVTAAATRIAADAYVGSSEPAGEAIRNVGRRTLPLVGLTVISSIGIAIGWLLCLVPGLLLQAAWAVAVPALILEGTGVTAALGRSYALTKSRFLLALGVVWSVWLLEFVLSIGLSSLLGYLIATNDSATGDVIIQSISNAASSIVTTPLVATAIVALYFDLRIRSEGFDVQMMLARLDARRAGLADAR